MRFPFLVVSNGFLYTSEWLTSENICSNNETVYFYQGGASPRTDQCNLTKCSKLNICSMHIEWDR